jgi:hypothetical protein
LDADHADYADLPLKGSDNHFIEIDDDVATAELIYNSPSKIGERPHSAITFSGRVDEKTREFLKSR